MIEALVLALAPVAADAPQPPRQPGIEEAMEEIRELDDKLFWAAFEGCDPEGLEDVLAEDFRMIHDQSGLVHPTRADIVDDLRENCARRAGTGYRNRRQLVPGSRTIMPLGGWGMIERGWHTFDEWDAENARWVRTGGASYIHIWRWEKDEERFRLIESISVDHGAARPYPPASG